MSRLKRNAPEAAGQSVWIAWLRQLCWFCLVWIYTELCLHVLVFGWSMERIVYPILFAVGAAALSSLICLWMKPGLQRAVITVVTALAALYAEVQYIYQAIFGSLMPLSQVTLGGNVLDFRSQLLYSLKKNAVQVLLLLLPVLVWVCLLLRRKIRCRAMGWKQALASLCTGLVFVGGALGLMYVNRDGTASVYSQFASVNTNTTVSYRSVGMVGTTVQELRLMLFPTGKESFSLEQQLSQPMPADDFSAQDKNILPIDFTALAAETDDPDLQMLDRFFSSAVPTGKNRYTGALSGFNVITICAESFSPWLISEELTPTLYRLSHGGFVFENYYGCFNAVTTNGEYTTCLGLLPDLSRTKTASSFDESIGHYLPFCLGNALKNLGYDTWAYHNYIGEFYNRNQTHTNMGYTFRSASSGLDISLQWPASDLELMQASVDDYIQEDRPFHAYYMTFSGHYQYDWQNAMSQKNRDRVRDLPYSETVKAFIACNLELEDGLTYLVNRLEQAGVMDRTLIVLTNDHYPYGLTEDAYNELAGQAIDTDFEKYRNSFILYTSALPEPVVVDEYCCTADILPTVLNLLGVPYDSRLLAGTDVLSDGAHVAILETHSFLTREFRYLAATGEVIPAVPGTVIPEAEVERWRTLAEQKFELSREILNHDYYSHVFSQSGLDLDLHPAAVYEDIKDVFAQASAVWLVEKGYIDADSETSFGGDRYTSLGEFVDSWYRISGRPETSADALPANYPTGQNDSRRLDGDTEDSSTQAHQAFDADYPFYDAICWAFEVGLLRPEDRQIGYDDPVSYLDVALLVKRYCQMRGVEIRLLPHTDADGKEFDAMQVMRVRFPTYGEEELEAYLWCNQEHIISVSNDLESALRSAEKPVKRNRVISYLFRTCSYELNMP